VERGGCTSQHRRQNKSLRGPCGRGRRHQRDGMWPLVGRDRYPTQLTIGGLEERHKLPQLSLELKSQLSTIFTHFQGHFVHLGACKNAVGAYNDRLIGVDQMWEAGGEQYFRRGSAP